MKKLNYALIVATLMLGGFPILTSCDDDNTDLENRVTVVEGMIKDMQSKLALCITTGQTIVNATQDAAGVWTLVLSDGTQITITPTSGGGAGGGSSVTVQDNPNNIIVTIDGKEYVLPKGAAGVSLVYAPEYEDGVVMLGNSGAEVRFLMNPALTDAQVSGATFDIAGAHELKSRVGSELFKVSNVAKDGDFAVVTIKGLGCAAATKYSVAVTALVDGVTTITSNYFTVSVAADYSDTSEQIGGFTIKGEYNPTEVDESGYCSLTVPGSELLAAGMNFKNLFSELPDGAKFELAKAGVQPGKAASKYDILAASLESDGTFAWADAPRTNFGDEGFIVKVIDGADVTRAKIYVKIDDPLAALDFAVPSGQFEVEWKSRTGYLEIGKNDIWLSHLFSLSNEQVYLGAGDSGTTDDTKEINFVMGDGLKWFEAYDAYEVSLNGKQVLFNQGDNLALGEVGKAYQIEGKTDGIIWYNRGIAITYKPEQMGGVGDYTEITLIDGSTMAPDGGYKVDKWWGDPNGNPRNINNEAPAVMKDFGIEMRNDGHFVTGENYKGWPMRTAIGAAFDYAYGTKKLCQGDQFMLLYFNRRRTAEGIQFPTLDYQDK